MPSKFCIVKAPSKLYMKLKTKTEMLFTTCSKKIGQNFLKAYVRINL